MNKILSGLLIYSDRMTNLIQPKIIEDDKVAFIGCSPRSGSTMLIRILDSHSKISAPCEIALPKYFRRDIKRKLVNEKFKQICDYYSGNFYLCKGNPEFLIRKIRQKENKETVVFKDPRQSLFFEKVSQDFINAKFIHLVRDARSVAMSPWFINNPKRGLGIWYSYNIFMLEVADRLEADYKMVIRYEDLVENTADTIKEVVDFLGYEFEKGMLNYGNFEHADDKMKLWHGTTAAKAFQHKELGAQVNKNVLKDRSKHSQEILKAYSQLEHVVKLNIEFGYML